MNATIEVLRNEAKRLRSLAERMEAFAAELDGNGVPPVMELPFGPSNSTRPKNLATSGTFDVSPREFKGLTQHAAILKALEMFGPQTTRELFNRLNAGGMAFKKPIYVSSILGRLKDVVERTPDKRVKLKEKSEMVNSPVQQ
jgi:hypothetical protein